MSGLPVIAHPAYSPPLPPGHRFPMGKFTALAAELARRGIARSFETPDPADRAALTRVHEPSYVDAVQRAAVDRATERRIGLPVTDAVARRAEAACGGTILTAERAIAAGIACNTAGGSHHARAGTGAGYCVFNDVAVAIRALQDRGRIARALVVDVDVHQGDGTAEIFAGDPGVFTLSLHAEKNFPLRKARSSLDVALPDATGDRDYLEALDSALATALGAFAADIVFYVAGVDVHVDDRLGRLALSDAGIAAREALSLERLRDAGLPVAVVLGGGYGPDPAIIARRHALVFEAAAARRAREVAGAQAIR